MPTLRAHLIYNPSAGQRWHVFDPQLVINYLTKQGWQVEARPTEYAGHGSELARLAVRQQVDVVIAAGGDGTINEVVQGLAHSEVKLGILPVGTTNVLARELMISLNFQEALEYLPMAIPKRIDLGRVNQRYFFLMAGIGYDAEVVRDINPQLKQVAGKTAVVTSGIANLFQHKPFKLKLLFVDHRGKKRRLRRSIMQIFVSNASTYATDYKIAEQAKMDDGLLELHIFKSKRFQDTFHALISLALRRHKEWVAFEHFSIRSLRIYARKPVPVQIDGDLYGHTPVTIEVVPQALYLLQPKNFPY